MKDMGILCPRPLPLRTTVPILARRRSSSSSSKRPQSPSLDTDGRPVSNSAPPLQPWSLCDAALEEFLSILCSNTSPVTQDPFVLPRSRVGSRGGQRASTSGSRGHRRRASSLTFGGVGNGAESPPHGSPVFGQGSVLLYSPISRNLTRNPLPRHHDYARLAACLHEMRVGDAMSVSPLDRLAVIPSDNMDGDEQVEMAGVEDIHLLNAAVEQSEDVPGGRAVVSVEQGAVRPVTL